LLLRRPIAVIALTARQQQKSIRGNYASVGIATSVCVENGYVYLATPSILRTVIPHLSTLIGSMKRRP
jgi:hypothetical protein